MSLPPQQTETLNILTILQSILSGFGDVVPTDIDINKLNTDITRLGTVSNLADNENNKLLLKQNETKQLIEDENSRIQRNIQTVENNLLTKKRQVEFNENHRLRTEQYNQMLYIVVLTLFIIVTIIIGFRRLSFLPDIILKLLIIIIGTFASMKLLNIYLTIQSRSHLNYNELNLDKPAIDSPGEIQSQIEEAARTGDLLGSISIGGCVGPACCDTSNNIVWNETSRKCTYQAGFSNMLNFNRERLRYNNHFASPNTPSELNSYSKV